LEEGRRADRREAKEERKASRAKREAGQAERRARLEDVRDEVELLEAQLAVKQAEVEAAKVVLEAAIVRLSRSKELRRSSAVSEEQLALALYDQQTARAQFAIRKAELREPEVRLKQARRRLKALETAARPADLPRGTEGRLRKLEKKLDAIRTEVGALREELRKARSGRP
jgi:hypothetical protein